MFFLHIKIRANKENVRKGTDDFIGMDIKCQKNGSIENVSFF